MSVDRGLNSLVLRAKWARGLLLFYMIEGALVLAFSFFVMMAIDSLTPHLFLFAATGIASLLSILVFVACVIAVLVWVHRAHANLHGLGLRGLKYSPAWAAASFFVPIVGLVVPFLAMRQLYNRSAGEQEEHADESVGDVSSWWACYVAGGLLQGFLILRVLFNLDGQVFITTPPKLNVAAIMLANVLLLGSAFFLWRIIGTVTEAQQGAAGAASAFA